MTTASEFPMIRKAYRIIGKNLVFRDASTDDAAFIFELRTDNKKAKYLSHTSPEMVKQIIWLEDYKKKHDQAYFIIENKEGEKLGTVRIYDPQGESFCWGSWILKDGVSKSAGIESALIVYAYALDSLGFKKAHFDVRKGNKNVWQFHERCGAVRVHETENDYIYRIEGENILSTRNRYKKYLPERIVIEKRKWEV